MRKIVCSTFIGLLTILSACDDGQINERVNYDRTSFLENTVDNIILPSFQDFNEKVAAMNNSSLTFQTSPSIENLQLLQADLKEAWLSFQYVAYLEIGPSADVFLRDEINIYPADTVVIESKINEGNYDLAGPSNLDTKGFPAIDYLINGTGATNEAIVAYYTDINTGTNRLNYLNAVVSEVASLANEVNSGWASYRSTFLEASGTDIGSSTGKLVNEFNKQFDLRLKNGKIGIPSGVKSLEIPNPGKVECYHGKYSKDLALASAQAALNIFKGVHFSGNTNGEGLDDYLDALNASNDGEALSISIIDAIQESINKIDAIEPSVEAASQVYAEDGPLVQSYYAMQAVIPLIKVDMTSEMGVTISFQDNDGD